MTSCNLRNSGRAGPPDPPLSCNTGASPRLAAACGACSTRALPAGAHTTAPPIEIKVCGLTTPAAAVACVAAGVDSIGMVFHPTSPRNLAPVQAQKIAAAIPAGVAKVGVFVNQTADEILRIAARIGLDTVQFHGEPVPGLYETLLRHGLHVVQKLCGSENRLLAQARLLPPAVGVLVECGRGALPGGNGTPWNWGEAAVLREIRPFAVAGGLEASNVAQALAVSGASGVDVSSGVEAAPGVKDLGKITAFVAAVRASGAGGRGNVFHSFGSQNSGVRSQNIQNSES